MADMTNYERIKNMNVKEMAKVIESSIDNLGCGNFNFTGEEISTMFAKALYNARYRKQSEVAREIFEEIEPWLNDYRNNFCSGLQFITFLAELKKKYTEGEI